MSLGQWAKPVLWLAATLCVFGQESNVVTCIASYGWTINSKGQTPCLVAAFLHSQCGVPTSVNAIPAGMHYLGPTPSQQDPCKCSSVTYSMVSACGACQGLTYVDWTTWSSSCLQVELATYPKMIPPQIEVPIWAYLNVSLTNGGFDPLAAQQALIANTTAISPISLSSSSSTSTSTISLATTAPGASSSLSASTSNLSDGKARSNAGGLAGAIVGGLAFLAIVILGLLLWIIHKRRNAIQKNLVFDSKALVSGPAVSQTTSGSSHQHHGLSPVPFSSPNLYDNRDTSYYPGYPVYTHQPQSQRSLVNISQSLAQFEQGGYQQHSQPRVH